MASGLLRVVLNRTVTNRPLHLTTATKIYGFYPPQVGPDPNINMEFYESLGKPLPPFPRVIKFQGELKALKEKEKGDWKNLSNEEKMDLYNLYFSMSMADMCRETDMNKSALGATCIILAFILAVQWLMAKYILPKRPSTIDDEEHVHAIIKKQLQLHSDPVTGYASMWDYKNNCWKK